MKETLLASMGAALMGFFTWLYSKWQTKREKKKTDLDLINDAIRPLLESIQNLTTRHNELIQKYIEEQNEKLALLAEKGELIEKIEHLEKQVKDLNSKINKLLKEKQFEKES